MRRYEVTLENFDLSISKMLRNHSKNFTGETIADAIDAEEHGTPQIREVFDTQAEAFRYAMRLTVEHKNSSHIIGGSGPQVLRTVYLSTAAYDADRDDPDIMNDYEVLSVWCPDNCEDYDEVEENYNRLKGADDDDDFIESAEEISDILPELKLDEKIGLLKHDIMADAQRELILTAVRSWLERFHGAQEYGLEFKDDVRRARQSAGLTQAQASLKLKIPKRTIENWEAGKTAPPDYVQRLVLRELDRMAEEN